MGTKQTKITPKVHQEKCRDLVLLCRRGDLKSTTRLVLLTLWSYTDSPWVVLAVTGFSLVRDTSPTRRSIQQGNEGTSRTA